MAAHPKWQNSISIVGISLTDSQRDLLAAAWDHFDAMHEVIHGCHPSRKQFIVALLMMAADDVLKVDERELMRELINRTGV